MAKKADEVIVKSDLRVRLLLLVVYIPAFIAICTVDLPSLCRLVLGLMLTLQVTYLLFNWPFPRTRLSSIELTEQQYTFIFDRRSLGLRHLKLTLVTPWFIGVTGPKSIRPQFILWRFQVPQQVYSTLIFQLKSHQYSAK